MNITLCGCFYSSLGPLEQDRACREPWHCTAVVQAELHAVISALRNHLVLPTERQNHLASLLVTIPRNWGRYWSRRKGWIKHCASNLTRQCVRYLCFTNFCDFETVFAGQFQLSTAPAEIYRNLGSLNFTGRTLLSPD